ncbi:MAG: hypothetical protein LC122_11820 [Chitinophagales bacterium]|nr:hypothetical protein [Chitinophagales bacterium]
MKFFCPFCETKLQAEPTIYFCDNVYCWFDVKYYTNLNLLYIYYTDIDKIYSFRIVIENKIFFSYNNKNFELNIDDLDIGWDLVKYLKNIELV